MARPAEAVKDATTIPGNTGPRAVLLLALTLTTGPDDPPVLIALDVELAPSAGVRAFGGWALR